MRKIMSRYRRRRNFRLRKNFSQTKSTFNAVVLHVTPISFRPVRSRAVSRGAHKSQHVAIETNRGRHVEDLQQSTNAAYLNAHCFSPIKAAHVALSVAAGICHNVGTAFFHGDHNALQA